jgi:voltage-gated potassium channel
VVPRHLRQGALATTPQQRRLGRISRRLLYGAAVCVLVLVVAPLIVGFAESPHDDPIHTPLDGYRWTLRTLFENVSPYRLRNPVSYVSYYTVRIAGYGLIALLTSYLASRFVATVIKREAGMGTYKGSRHLLICGWSSKGSEIIRDFRSKEVEDPRPIVILAELERSPSDDENTEFLRGNPSNGTDLGRAGVDRAETAIVLADHTGTSNDVDDIDARSLLTTLAIESINADCYTCVEVMKSENRQHFERTRANELVVSGEITGAVLAASARTHGLSDVIRDLLTHPEGQEFYRMTLPAELAGRTTREVLQELKDADDSMLVGVFDNSSCKINPPSDQVLPEGTALLVIRDSPPIDGNVARAIASRARKG